MSVSDPRPDSQEAARRLAEQLTLKPTIDRIRNWAGLDGGPIESDLSVILLAYGLAREREGLERALEAAETHPTWPLQAIRALMGEGEKP